MTTVNPEEAILAEQLRLERLIEVNLQPGSREYWEKQYGQVWDTEELSRDFEVRGFMAPFVVVKRHSDGVIGTLEFSHSPRFYFNFAPDSRD